MNQLLLDGRTLRLDDLRPVFDAQPMTIGVAEDALSRVKRARQMVERIVDKNEAVYGLTTGFGKLKSVAIPSDKLQELQTNLVLSHCCGVGENMPVPEVRAVQVLRLNGLLRGHSGIRTELVESLVRYFNKGLVPVVPQQGSVGASGDLAPLAHITACYMGYGQAFLDGEELPSSEALARIEEKPLVLEAKEGLALINGTEVMAAIGSGVLLRARNISKASDVLAALTIEALLGSVKPFDARLADLKGQPGHTRTATNVRLCIGDSEVQHSHVDCGRVQDPYSLRCVPQVHGSYKAAMRHVEDILGAELNSVTDNPILFPDTDEVISAGQFHGQPISMALDYLGLSLCTLANISERRIEQLVNPDLSRLPSFLASKPGLNSGMMIAQVAAASLASENKAWAHPASIDTIPTSANQEDHVSMGVTAARKARAISTNVERVLAIEWLCAAQAREFNPDTTPGPGAQAAYDLLREHVPSMERDRYLKDDIEMAWELLRSGRLIEAVEAAVGPLEA